MDQGKRGTGSGSKNLFQRGGIWYARAQVNDREYRRSLKTRNRREAERRLAAWLKTLSPYHGTVRGTFKEAAVLWLEAGQWKPKTAHSYAKLLKVLLVHFGEMYWDEVDKGALQAFAASRKEAGSGVATTNRYLTVISGIANHVRELPEWADVNPVELLAKKPRIERRGAYVRPPVEDIELMLSVVTGTFRDLCRFALLTGARRDEIAYLKRSDARNGKAQLWETKSKFRVIQLSPAAREIVDRQPVTAGSEYLFNTRNRGPYLRVTEMWREALIRAQKSAQKAGRSFTRMRFHDMRHEYAIRELENGRPIMQLRDHLGHSTVQQTEAYLRFLTPEQAAIVRGGSAQM